MFVVNADQVRSRTSQDRIPAALAGLADSAVNVTLPFERTVGDEIQGVLASGADVVTCCRILASVGQWHLAVGLGAVEDPLPRSTRAARGTAFLAARRAAEVVKGRKPSVLLLPHGAGDTSPEAGTAEADADVALRLLAALWARRTEAGWAAVTETERARAQDPTASLGVVAEHLGISHQALSQRLRAADWDLEADALVTVGRLLDRADGGGVS